MTTERRIRSNPTGSPTLAALPAPGTLPPTGLPPTPRQAQSEQLARQSCYVAHLQPGELGDWQQAMRLDAAEEEALPGPTRAVPAARRRPFARPGAGRPAGRAGTRG